MPVPYKITYEVEDEAANRATFGIKVLNSFSLSQYTEFGRSLSSLIDPVISGILKACTLTLPVDISALTSNVTLSSSDVEEVAAFQFQTANGDRVMVNIPGVNEAKVAANSNDLDQADPDIAAFITAMESGIAVTLDTIIPCDVAEQDLSALVYARENFRASGRTR